MRQEGQIGALVPGAWADLLIVDGDPTQGLSMFSEPEAGLRLIMQGGRIVTDTLAAG